jgi:Ser/Thr protein kinase RdoA (MazF antagonist)
MKRYSELTQRGKARRLREVAFSALAHYDLEISGLELVGMFTNVLFRVRTVGGQSYVLRWCTPGWRTDTDIRSEISWLQALAESDDIGAPVPLLSRDGEQLVKVGPQPGVPGSNRCVVMSWIPGTPLGRHLSAANLKRMGSLFAMLHAHGAAFVPPPGFTERRMISYIARDEPDVLFSEANSYAFTAHSCEVLTQTRMVVAQAFADLYADRGGLCVIHNDLWHDNIMLYRGRLHPFDFEDTIWGYPVQDIAMSLQDLMTDVPPDKYEPYAAAFREGYESLAAWPEQYEGQIDVFRAGRLLWVANYIAGHERQYLQKHLVLLTRQLDVFLETGRIRKLPETS